MCANFTSQNPVETMDDLDTEGWTVFTTIKPRNVKKLNEQGVTSLLSMIGQAQTTSALIALEKHREKSSKTGFRSLILLLTTELNKPTWIAKIHGQDDKSSHRSFASRNSCLHRPASKAVDINRCSLVLLYYIVSVIHKYEITNAEPIWTEILNNFVTKTMTFYRFLDKHKIIIPEAIRTYVSKHVDSFYLSQSARDKIKLIRLGSTVTETCSPTMSIKEWEIFLTELKQQQLFNRNLKPQQFVSAITAPEKLSLFLSYFPDYDLNTIDPRTNNNILDTIINMKPYFYLAPEDKDNTVQLRSRFIRHGLIRPRDTDPSKPSKLCSRPNEITKYRAARILNLLQSVILQDAQLSRPFYQDWKYNSTREKRFFTTSIGMYALIGLRLSDIYPGKSSREHDSFFVPSILKSIKKFQPIFQKFILKHLSISYSLIHKSEFMIEERKNETIQTQAINDELFQKSLTLKEWCRLKLKDGCSQKNIIKLNLSKSLIDYCSFGLFSSNYALKCIREITKHKGHIMPDESERGYSITHVPDGDNSDNELAMDGDNDDEDANSAMSVDSFDENDIS